MEENRRRDKQDDALLFLMGSVGILFGLIQVYAGFSTILQFIIPVALLGWILPFYYGFVRGAIGGSIADRYRGWIFLVIGLALYALILAEMELSRFVTDSRFEWVVPLSFSPVIIVIARRLGPFRKFVLGPAFPTNIVLSRSAWNAMWVAVMIALAGGFLAIVNFLSVLDLLVIGPLGILAAIFMRRSNYYATRIYSQYELVGKAGRLHGHRRVELTYRILKIIIWGLVIVGTIPAGLVGYLGCCPSLVPSIVFPLFGLTFVLLVPTVILYFLTRDMQDFQFNEPDPEPLPDEDL